MTERSFLKAWQVRPQFCLIFCTFIQNISDAMVFNAQGKTDEALNVTDNYQVSEEVKNQVDLLLKDSLMY